MRLQRRTLWSVLALFLVALGACRKKEEGPVAAGTEGAAAAIETKAVGGDLPAGALVVISAHDLESFWTRLKATQFYTQLTAIPEVKAKLDTTQNRELAQAFQQFQAVTGVPLNEQTLFHTLGKKVQLGVYAQGTADTTAPRVVVVADVGDKDALDSMLSNVRKAAEGDGRAFRNESYKGVDVTVVSDTGGAVRALYGFHKEKLVAASDQAGLQSAVDALDGGGSTMSADSLYRRALPHVGEASVTIFVRKDVTRALLSQARRSAEQSSQAAAADRLLEVADRYNVQSAFVSGVGWTDQGLDVRTYSMFDPASSGAAPLREMLQTPPSEVKVTGYYPDSTIGFYAANFLDAPKIYDFAVAYMKDAAAANDSAAGPAAAAQVDSAIAGFESQVGMSIRSDILGWMGKEAAVGLNGVVEGGFFPVPELSLVIQAADAARAKAFFDKVEAQVTAAAQQSQGFPLQFQEEDYKGTKIRFAPTPMGEGLAPAYAIHEAYVLVALSRGTLKRMLDVKTGTGQAVRANPQFQSLGGFYPAQANVVGFLDMARLLTEIGSAVSTMQQMSGKQASPESEDMMNRVLAALKNIQAVGSFGVNDPGGVEQRFLIKIQ
jgi:hypothetical protein